MKITHLRLKIFLPVLALFIAANLIVYGFVVKSTANATREQMNTDLMHMANSVSDIVTAEIEKEFTIIRTLSNIKQIKDTSVSLYDKSQIVYDFFDENHGAYIDMCILDLEGFAYVNATKKVSFAERNYYKIPLTGVEYVEPPFVNKVTNAMAIFFATPVRDAGGKVINVVFSVINGYRICDLMKKYPLSDTSNAIVIDAETGKIQGSADRTLLDENKNILDIDSGFEKALNELKSGNSGTVEYVDNNGIATVAAFRKIDGTKWAIIAPAPISDFDGANRKLQKVLIGLFVVIIALLSLVLPLIIKEIIKPVKALDHAIAEISENDADLTKTIKTNSADEIGRVVNNFNSFTQVLRDIIVEVKASKNELSVSGDNLSLITDKTVENLDFIMSEIKNVDGLLVNQIDSVQSTVGSISQITDDISVMKDMIEKQSHGVSIASSAIENMIDNISSVNSSTEKMSDSFDILSQKAQEGTEIQGNVNLRIGEIEEQAKLLVSANSVINSIASETNLLAMNAAIEAAHAGSAGQGFAVVADEIRKLSENSSVQSKTIGQQIGKIRDSIENLVKASQKSNQVFLAVSDQIAETQELVIEINNAMREQLSGSSQVRSSLSNVNSSTEEVLRSSSDVSSENEKITAKIRKLEEVTENIRKCVASMNNETVEVESNSKNLAEISSEMHNSIGRIGSQIDLFKV